MGRKPTYEELEQRVRELEKQAVQLKPEVKKVKCWQFLECNDKDCPAYKSKELRCWLISETHCRNEIQGKFFEKMEGCLKCEHFRANMDVSSMEETLRTVNKQLTEFRRMVEERDRELEDTSLELAIGLSEAFEALKQISLGNPEVKIPETSEFELIRKLQHMVNLTAENLEETVNLSHEFAIGLAEHFSALDRVSKGDLTARVSGTSQVELLESLSKVTNHMIESVSTEIAERKQAVEALEKAHVELEQRVEERTAELAKTAELLELELAEHKRAEERAIGHAEELTRYSTELEDFSKSVSLRIRKVLNEVRDDLNEDEIEPHISADFKKGQSLIDKVNGLQNLITNIVWYTASKAKIQKLEEVNSSKVLYDVKQDLKAEINELDATVDYDSLPTILFNREKLFMLFRCLLSNAIKFHGQSAPIVSIKAEQEDNKWVFSVQDNGIGIHSAYIDKVFNVWCRAHNAVQYPGEGIGLTICKNILEYNNERIWLDSEPGRGPTFHFTVPATGDAS